MRSWHRISLVLLALVWAWPAAAQEPRIMTGPDIDAACGGSGLEATIVHMSTSQSVAACVENSNYCRTMSVYDYAIRCDGGRNAGRQLTGIQVWWAAHGSRNPAKARVVNNRASVLVDFNDVIAGPRTGWLTLPEGRVPINSQTRIATRALPPPPKQAEVKPPVVPVAAPEPPPQLKPVNWFQAISPFWEIASIGLAAVLVFFAYQGVNDVELAGRSEAARDNQDFAVSWLAGLFLVSALSSWWLTSDWSFFRGLGGFLLLSSLGMFLLFFSKAVLRGWHYVFVGHPAAPVVETALGKREAIDPHTLSDALTPDLSEVAGEKHKWSWQYQAEARRARELADKLRADEALARAAIERERTRRGGATPETKR